MGIKPRRASFISQLPINKIITMCKIVNVLVDNLFLTDEKIFLKDSGDRHTVKRVILNIFSFGQNPNGTIEYNKEWANASFHKFAMPELRVTPKMSEYNFFVKLNQ